MAQRKGIIVKYECGSCNEQHDYEDEARDCCMPSVSEVYFCPVCDWEHSTMEAAEGCVASHADLPDLPDSCPSCLRPAESAMHRVEVAVAGHCSTCNPIYTPEENIAIKYALEPKE